MIIIIIHIDVTSSESSIVHRRRYSSKDESYSQPPPKILKTDEQMPSLSVKGSDLQPYIQKKRKIDQQTQLSFNTKISTLPQHVSENTISNAFPGCTMNPDQLIENVSECSSIKSIGQQISPQSSTVMCKTRIGCHSHEIRLYRNYQKARYQRMEFPTYFKQPTPSIRKFINLELVKKRRESKEERIEGMTDKLYGNVSRFVQQREPLGIEQIAEVNESNKLPRNILIEGDPGVGKTTLVWELCKGWEENRLLHQWDVVVLVQLRDIDAREASNLEQLLDPDEQFRSELDYIKRTNGNGVMIIFDGYDELSQKQKQRTSVFQRILVGKLLPGATLLVTSRPIATRELPMEFREQLHRHIEVVGFSDNDIYKYIECKFCDNSDMLKEFLSYISCHLFIYKAMYIPLHCALVTDLYQTYWRKGKKEFAPKTITQLCTCFIHSLLERYLDDHPVYGPQELNIQELTDLPQDVYEDLIKLAQLAAKGIEEQQYVFDNLMHNTLGLMQRVIKCESRKSKSVSYSFLHLTLQEYLAALYWSQLPPEVTHLFTESGVLPVKKHIKPDPLRLLNELIAGSSNIHRPALYFYAGITKVVGTPLESMCRGTNPYGMSVNVAPELLYLLFESQNPEYVSTILKESQYEVYIKSRYVGYITGYCISHCCSTAKWRIRTKQHLLQSIITGTSSRIGGIINGLDIDPVTDYSECFQMLFQLEVYTKHLTFLRLVNLYKDNDNKCCDELAQLYKYYPKLQMLILRKKGLKLDFTPCFLSLHHMRSLNTLWLTGFLINDSCHIVCHNQPTQELELILNDCDLISLSAETLLLNTPFNMLYLNNISLNVQSSAALKQFIEENKYSNSCLSLSGSLHCLNCTSDEEHYSLITRQVFEGIQRSKNLYKLALKTFELNKELAIALKQVLMENTTLQVLQLEHSIKSMDVAEVVAIGLQCNTGVVCLKLCHSAECTDGVIQTLLQGLSYNHCLETLNLLAYNGIELNIKDYHILNDLLIRNKSLKELIICENVDHEKAQYLANSLVNCNLKRVSVFDDGKMGQAGAKHLVDAVMKNSNTQMLTIPSDYKDYSFHTNKVRYESTDECKLL